MYPTPSVAPGPWFDARLQRARAQARGENVYRHTMVPVTALLNYGQTFGGWVAWDTMDQVAARRVQQDRLRAADELGVGREYRELLTMWGRRV